MLKNSMATRRAYHESTPRLTRQIPPWPAANGGCCQQNGGEVNMSAQLTGILQIAITAKEIDRATAFYRDVLGLRLLFNAPNMAFFDCGGVRLYLASGEGAEQHGASSFIYFRTGDISGLMAALKGKRVSIYPEPHIIALMPGPEPCLIGIRASRT